MIESLQDLLPDDLELQLGQTQADAAMDAEAERQMLARAGAVDDEVIWTLDSGLVAVARDIPHHDLVALPDLLAAELDVGQRRAAHMGERRLPADHLGHEAVEQRRIVLELAILFRVLAQRVDAARHRVARGIVAADDQEHEIAEE